MMAGKLATQTITRVREVDKLFGSLSRELEATMNPHNQAMRSLGVDKMGWVGTPYNDEAFKIWSELIKQNPNDVETMHHLAVMHHARAIELEAGKDPRNSNRDWETALKYWHRLWKSEAFWTRIADLACKNTKRDPVERLKENFPVLLLQIHFDIAFDPKTKNYRAEYHIRTALDSRFPDEAKQAVRRNTYQRFISVIPASIWQPSEMDPAVIKQGSDRIEEYLKLDTECIQALEDALRLQVRLVSALNTEWTGLDEHEETSKTRILNKLKTSAEYWKPYLQPLVDSVESLEDDTRRKLLLWNLWMGNVHDALSKYDQAITFYENALKAANDEEASNRVGRALSKACAILARERASNEGRAAKPFCDEVRRKPNLSIVAHFVLANAYLILRELDTAEEVCKQGMAIQPDYGDYQAVEEHDNAMTHLNQMLLAIGQARSARNPLISMR